MGRDARPTDPVSFVIFFMRVLHVITRLIFGGAQQNTVMSCKAQSAGGHEVTLAFGPIYGPEGSLLEEARASGARIVQIEAMRRAVDPWHDAVCYRALRRLIREVRPEVVHTHSSKAGILGRAAAWKERVPAVIHTVHGLPFHDRQSAPVRRVYIAAERWAAKRCHHLIAITPAMVEAFATQHIAPPERFTVIHSGVDTERFRPRPETRAAIRAELGIAAEAPVVGIVARFDPYKGHDDLLEMFPRLEERFPGVRLLFVGDGWDRARIEAHPVVRAGKAVLTGLVALDRMAEYLAAMDVKVLPSYQEGQSRTLVEALMCECPIVAYDVGGIGSVCIDGETGLLVPIGDREKLAQAIAWMLEHPRERAEMAKRGRLHVHRTFSAQAMFERLEMVYGMVLDRKD